MKQLRKFLTSVVTWFDSWPTRPKIIVFAGVVGIANNLVLMLQGVGNESGWLLAVIAGVLANLISWSATQLPTKGGDLTT